MSGVPLETLPGTRDGRARRWVEVAGLSAFAFSQPLFSVLADGASFLVAHGLSGARLVGFVILLSLVPPSVLVILDEVLLAVSGRRYRPLGTSLRGLLIGLILGPPLNRVMDMDGLLSVVSMVALAVLGTMILRRWEIPSAALGVFALAPMVFAAWFLMMTPVSALLNAEDPTNAQALGRPDASVIWIIFDQFPLSLMLDSNGDLADDRFPNFARLASESTWYSAATTVSNSTELAVPAILSGRYREPGSLPVASTTPQNLFTILGRTHRINAYETFTQICPDSLCQGSMAVEPAQSLISDAWVVLLRTLLADGVADHIVPEIEGTWAGFGFSTEGDLRIEDEATTRQELQATRVRGDDRDRFVTFLRDLSNSTGTAVHYLHLEKPHEPLMFLPDGRRYDHCACFKVNDDGTWPEHPAMAFQRLQRYLLQAMYVDTLLGRVLDAMEAKGLGEESILVVLSDHGASLLPGTHNRALTAENLHDITPVPLFIREPGQTRGVRDTRVVQLIDVLPTVVDLLGGRWEDFGFDGASLLDPIPVDRPLRLSTRQGQQVLEQIPDAARSLLPRWLDELNPDPANPYAFGAGAELLGRLVEGLVAGQSDLELLVETPTRSQFGVGDQNYIANHIFGSLSGSEAPVDLVVAVNGVVAGMGTSFHNDDWRVSLMVDPEHLRAPTKSVEIYEMIPDGLLLVSVSWP